MNIPFNVPPETDNEIEYLRQAVQNHKISGDGEFTQKCNAFLEEKLSAEKVMLTTSGTSALDMAAILCNLHPGDEVILPSFTFSSTATAFILCGAQLVFVDIRPDTMNIDETKIEEAITDKTKVIVCMHYGGVACEMDTIMDLARRYGLKVVEDAAQAIFATYKGRPLGTIGDFGCFSFHETKNFSMGEGGAIIINDRAYIERAEILREKGTNRSKFFRGEVDKYTWVDYGDSYLPSELNAAYLWPQFLIADIITKDRLSSWNTYYNGLKTLADKGFIELPVVPEGCQGNGHNFWIKCKDLQERTALISRLKEKGICAVFHYVPLHSAPAGYKYGRFSGKDRYTTRESERVLRLPMYYRLNGEEQEYIVKEIEKFYSKR